MQVYREGCEKRATIAALKREREHAILVEANIANRNAAEAKLVQATRDQGLEAIDPQSALKAAHELAGGDFVSGSRRRSGRPARKANSSQFLMGALPNNSLRR